MSLKPGQGKGLLQVDVPDAAATPPPGETFGDPEDPRGWKDPWISIKETEEMARRVAKGNIKNYNQAHHTPFAGSNLDAAIGKYAETAIAEKILNGEELPEHLTVTLKPETKRILNTLGKKPQLVVNKAIKSYITAEEFKAMYKVIPERTASSPSD